MNDILQHIINSANTETVDLGPSIDFVSIPDPTDDINNFITIHRHYNVELQKWGNFCSKIVTRLSNRDERGLPVRWYHIKIFNFCYKQYDKYGDYYRVIDNTYGKVEHDDIYEVI